MKKDLLAVGTMAFDSIKTPAGKRDRTLGGSLTHFMNAFCRLEGLETSVVSVIGKDFADNINFFKERNIDVSDVEVLDGKTFFWEGYYEGDLNQAYTVTTELNVLEKFNPQISDANKDCRFLFLGNIDPDLQLSVLEQVNCDFSMLDTMNFWLEIKKPQLFKILEKLDALVINDQEAFLLTGEANYLKSAKKIFDAGVKYLLLKKGSHGASFFSASGDFFQLPAFPVENLCDPTGAGDSFAGAFISYLAKNTKNGEKPAAEQFKEALAYATVIASFYVEGFGVEGLLKCAWGDIQKRFKSYFQYSSFPNFL